MASLPGVRWFLPITLTVVALLASGADAADVGGTGRTISTAGVTLQIPAGWQAEIAMTPACDPERLVVASSAPTEIGPDGQLPFPRTGAVSVVLLEDRYRQDRPSGDLQRPRRFSVTWTRLSHLEPCCGLPAAPAYMRYFKTHGRYLGFIVYPGTAVNSMTREATVTLMDSLRVAP